MRDFSWRQIPITFFFLVLFAVPFWWLLTIDAEPERSMLENRWLAEFPRGWGAEPDAQVQFQQQLAAAAADQIPFRPLLLTIAKRTEQSLIQLGYAFLPDAAIPADFTGRYLITRDRTMLMEAPLTVTEANFPMIDQRIANYEALIDAHPDIHFYAYYVERVRNASYHPLLADYPNAENGRGFEYFQQHQPDGLMLGALTFEDISEYSLYNYNTDHHWNIHGVVRAYQDLYGMISSSYPDIPDPIATGNLFTYPVDFYGSYARLTLARIEPDPFAVVLFDLPAHTEMVDGDLRAYSNRQHYLNNQVPMQRYTDHYSQFFGGNHAMVVFTIESNPDRNLLIIGNSYINPLVSILAYHYRTTYAIHLEQDPDFSFSEFLEDHPVDDVLVLGSEYVVYLDPELWNIGP
ncbi:MAG: hypothetical protein HPY85_06520 [Anaerolineae bacterium]|nr:hypothetical protein [Anaerolineae bacterium]